MAKIKLGDKVKDKITGYTGIVVGMTEFLQGCKRMGVRSQKLHDHKPIDAQWFDEPQLELIKQKKRVVKKTRGNEGGPMSSVPTRTSDHVSKQDVR